MIIENIPKSLAELYKSMLSELRPDWYVKIDVEDYDLYKLGFVDEIPCSISFNVSNKQMAELYDEIIDMEVSVYMHEDLLLKNPINMTLNEKIQFEEVKKLEEEYYNKYRPLEGLAYDLSEE